MLALGVFEAEPRYLVPVGGMVIGNAMTAAAVALNRLADEVRGQARRVEATLALGATARQATEGLVTGSLRSAMIPLIDQTKTTGVVTFPGTMVGDAGRRRRADRRRAPAAHPAVGAAGSVALAALIATGARLPRASSPSAHQLREPPAPTDRSSTRPG